LRGLKGRDNLSFFLGYADFYTPISENHLNQTKQQTHGRFRPLSAKIKPYILVSLPSEEKQLEYCSLSRNPVGYQEWQKTLNNQNLTPHSTQIIVIAEKQKSMLTE
jgi:hypothetical protein